MSQSLRFEKGDGVEWNWGSGTGTGKIVASFTEPVTITIDGTAVRRNADAEKPAYLIAQEDGQRVLKSQSELTAH